MGVTPVKLPYSQPWYKPQLEETIDELERAKREVSKLRDVVSSIAKERDSAFDAGRRSAEIIVQKGDEAKTLQARIDAAEDEAARERNMTEVVRREKEGVVSENVKLKARIATLGAELDDLKGAMAGFLDDRVKAEKTSAEAAVSAAAAQAEARRARREREEADRERDAAKTAADVASKAERERQASLRETAERAEAERRARLEARIIKVPEQTREFLDQKITQNGATPDFTLKAMTEKFLEPKCIWDMLEPKNYEGQHDSPIVLLSAAWLRTQRPSKLPDRARLPADALIPVRSLRAIHATIEKGMGKMTKPLPIVAVLHPNMRLDPGTGGATHPVRARHHASTPGMPSVSAPIALACCAASDVCDARV